MKTLVTCLLLLPLSMTFADDRIGISYLSETADIGEIHSVSVFSQVTAPDTHLGFQLRTGLNYAQIMEWDGFVEDFVAWESGIRLGFFSDIQLYVEAGFDTGEAIFDEAFNTDYDHHHHDDNDVDSYLGWGAGLQKEFISVQFVQRFRHMNGLFLEESNDVFTGVEFSLSF